MTYIHYLDQVTGLLSGGPWLHNHFCPEKNLKYLGNKTLQILKSIKVSKQKGVGKIKRHIRQLGFEKQNREFMKYY